MNNLNYGVIGSCQAAALISQNGDIEWLCFPDFDSPSIFTNMLDREKGGAFGFEVSGDYRITQNYALHTNVLSTQFSSGGGEFVVLDCMPCYRLQDETGHYLPAELYRYIHWIKGEPRFKINYHPAPNYAQGQMILSITPQYIKPYYSFDNRDRQYLYVFLFLRDIKEKKEIILKKDEFLLFFYNKKVIPIDIKKEKIEYCRTLVYWLNWTDRNKKYTLYDDVVEQGLLVLRLMSYHSGAILIILTISLPEAVREVRNWNYRFCWPRDASMPIETMFQVGHTDTAKCFVKFIQSTFVSKHDYQITYGIRDEYQLTKVILDHLSGYENSRPVRIGNNAYHQKQNDSSGYLMDLICQYYRLMPNILDEIEDMWGMIKTILAKVVEDWRKSDRGIWEIRGEGQHFVSSKVMCWVALDRGAEIAQMLNKYNYSGRWQLEAEKIKKDVVKYGWSEEPQSFTQTYNNQTMDSSLLLMEPYGFIETDDIRYHKTVEAVKKALFHKGLMYRYNSEDDSGSPTSVLTICTLWLIRVLFITGHKGGARCLFDEVLKYSNHLGLSSEDIDFKTKEQLGNPPQVYSHLALVNTAILSTGEEKRLSFIRPQRTPRFRSDK